MITLLAYAKINLFLDITGKRGDGCHLLETVMQSIDLADVVSVERVNSGITVTCSDPTVPENEGNICHKAAERFFAECGVSGGAGIHIDKRIPHGAGLGGGSADAAATLRGLNELSGRPLDEETLLRLAASIGADVPFCMAGGTKLCRGIGEEMSDTPPYPAKCFLIVKPDFGCGTKAAYAEYDRKPVPVRERKAGEYYNVFRAIYKNERLNAIVAKLIESGADGAELTGSGSAAFGAFSDEETATAAARQFAECFTAVCKPVKGLTVIDSKSLKLETASGFQN